MASRRAAAPALQWRRLQAMLGYEFADDELPPAIAAGRGTLFQRLEFLGDPVLELAVAGGLLHATRAGYQTAADELARRVARSTDTRRLAATGLARQLGSLLGFRASHKRRGDMVEACAGALFLDGGWAAVDGLAVAAGMIPDPPPPRAAPPPEALDDDPSELVAAIEREAHGSQGELARARVVGTMVIDTALAWWAYRTMPGRDEGVLTAVVHERAARNRLAAAANRHHLPDIQGRAENRLRAWMGVVADEHGRAAAVALASQVLNLGTPPGVDLRR